MVFYREWVFVLGVKLNPIKIYKKYVYFLLNIMYNDKNQKIKESGEIIKWLN